ITRLLLIRGVNFDKVDENSKSALHYVGQYGDSDICRLLLCCGAHAGGYDYGHLTPLHLAVYCNRLETVKVLLEFDSVRKTIDMFTEDDDTALIIAAEGGYTRIVEVLLAYGANYKLCNSLGESPLDQAAVRGNADVVKVLLQNGARADIKNEMGRTPLEMA
ncbi:ankyrin repeat-containing domain protein, partial [Trichophaea hybrida]